jgi:CRISPR-associated protein (TIGR02584 family)
LTPETYPRRILLLVTGLSPQVVTETVYALAVQRDPPFVPTEVQLLTTTEGAERARLSLLSEEPGWFGRLCHDYGLTGIRFDGSCIQVLDGPDGQALADIRTPADNEHAADRITEAVRTLTADPNSALHVSLAGGRKTMGFFAGYALSLFGRPQDRLSHVLIEAPFESHPDFFYPTPRPRVVYTPPPDSRPLDASQARVSLAAVPFVRLREGLPTRLLEGRASFTQAVDAAQRALAPPELVLEPERLSVVAAGESFTLKPADFAFYRWLADRRLQGRHAVRWNDPDLAEEYLAYYRDAVGEMSGEYERAEDALSRGMDKDWFLQRKARTNGAIERALGAQLAQPYLIVGSGNRPHTRFGLGLEPDRIQYHPGAGPEKAAGHGKPKGKARS